MTLRNDISLSRVPLAGFCAIGTGWGGFAAATPALKHRLELTESDLGFALFCAAIGAVLAMALVPKLFTWMGRGRGTITLGITPFAFGYVLVGQAGNFTELAMATFLMGLGTGYLDVLINARIAATESQSGRHLMSLAHGSFSLLYAITAFIMGLGRETDLSLPTLYILLALAVMGWSLMTLRDPGFEPEQNDQGTGKTARSKVPPVLLLISIMVMVAFFAENSTEIWAALHIEQTLGGRAAQGALGPTMLGLTMAVGRFSGQGLANRFGARPVMATMALMGAAGGFTAAIAPTPTIAYIGFACLGLGISSLAPLAFNLGGQYLDRSNVAHGIARMTLIGYLGFFVGPPITGMLAEAFGLRVSFGLIAVALAMLPLLLTRIPQPTPSAPVRL